MVLVGCSVLLLFLVQLCVFKHPCLFYLLHENILVVALLVLVDKRVRLLEDDLVPVGVGLLEPEEQLLGRGLELQDQNAAGSALGDGHELSVSWEQDQILN